MRNKITIKMSVCLLLLLLLFVQCKKDKNNTSGQTVKLEFFQTKREAIKSFDLLIAKFEAENPGIIIEQNFSPEAETVIKSRLVKNDIPDLLAIGGNFTYGELARAGVLADFSNDPLVDHVLQAYLEMLGKLTDKKEIHGLPYSANANTVLYNKDKFKKLGLEPPQSWNEFIDICQKIKAEGEIPLYLTFKDAWTIMVPFNSLAANLQGENFIELRKANQTTFSDKYIPVADKLISLLDYGHQDNFGVGYDDGNTAFARGEAYMLIQGIWAINSIKNSNTDINIGVFALPVTNSINRLISGIDTVLTMSANTKHKDEARKFIEFMLREDNCESYINNEKLFSTIKGIYQEDPELVGIKDYFKKGLITSFPDHYYPPGMQVANLVQEYLLQKDSAVFLTKLDQEWDKVVARQ